MLGRKIGGWRAYSLQPNPSSLAGNDFKKEFAGIAVAVEEELIPDSELPVAQSFNYNPEYFNIAEAKVVPTARIYAQNFLNSGQIESDIITLIG